MEISELLKYRIDLLEECQDDEKFISEQDFLTNVMPFLNDAKLVDSEDYNDCFHLNKVDNLKVNGYVINESGERLQIFLVDEVSIDVSTLEEDLLISQKSYYDQQFNKAFKFVNKSIKKHLDEDVQDSSPAKALVNFLSSTQGLEQIDVIEIFLVSTAITVEKRGAEPQPKKIEFDDDNITFKYTVGKESRSKSISVFKRLIDLNFIYNVLISQGNREVLVVNFENLYPGEIHLLRAADEEHFESYLCVLPAALIAELYRKYSTRILEKNVRSFLQFKGVNQGIRDTIKKTPELFIAYNNGMTITAVDSELKENNGQYILKSLTDFQIVNGGQTTASIYFSKKEGLDISKVRVMAKINVAKNTDEDKLNEFISQISIYSNAQSKVSSTDLRSRNEQLVKLKAVSESTLTPTGKKWFFERFKGEFNTLIRKNPAAKTRINNEYPKERRFSKEELAKYYMSWGDQPYMVKKGGEKIFRSFIEIISGEEKKKAPAIDRDFFEETIARIMLFRTLEKQYGAGKNSLGQLRSAVVPYSIAIIYKYAGAIKTNMVFDLAKIWKQEQFDESFLEMSYSLMDLMNNLIKKYALSDDLGEYSKKEELWDAISKSSEIKQFIESDLFKTSILRLLTSKDAKKATDKASKGIKHVDFSKLYENVLMYSKTAAYYQKLGMILGRTYTANQQNKFDKIVSAINNKEDVSDNLRAFEMEYLNEVRISQPNIFDKIAVKEESKWLAAYDFVLSHYNSCIENKGDIRSVFQREREIFKAKNAKFYSVLDEIGNALHKGEAPTMKELYSLCSCLQLQ
ncbi:AIPR family protein [Sphingobacterium sp. HMA12]|uniref:AIPR family protein n=1 Tax=Sphingobacterium sp. HMA12 TaxID=2050894 RepID=UPI000CEA6EDF|nr:AIPR family protein [Sphingobacterium sp. HMA12]